MAPAEAAVREEVGSLVSCLRPGWVSETSAKVRRSRRDPRPFLQVKEQAVGVKAVARRARRG